MNGVDDEHNNDNANSFFFFGGLAIPLTQAILAHLFSYNMQWAATKKEVERSNFFKEIPKIARRCVSLRPYFILHVSFCFAGWRCLMVCCTPTLCSKAGKRFPRECVDLELNFTLPYFASLFRRIAPLHFMARTCLPTPRSRPLSYPLSLCLPRITHPAFM